MQWVLDKCLDKDVDRTIPSSGRQKPIFNYAIIGLLIFALAVSITFNVTGVRGGIQATEKQPFAMRRSIAVLPFASLTTLSLSMACTMISLPGLPKSAH